MVSSAASRNSMASGSTIITAWARNFGVWEFSSRVRVSVSASPGLNAATAARASYWRSDSSTLARVASGVGGLGLGVGILVASVGL